MVGVIYYSNISVIFSKTSHNNLPNFKTQKYIVFEKLHLYLNNRQQHALVQHLLLSINYLFVSTNNYLFLININYFLIINLFINLWTHYKSLYLIPF